jgi:hypothetical protein
MNRRDTRNGSATEVLLITDAHVTSRRDRFGPGGDIPQGRYRVHTGRPGDGVFYVYTGKVKVLSFGAAANWPRPGEKPAGT